MTDPVADYLAAKDQRQSVDPVSAYLAARKAKPPKRSLPTDANNQATTDELAAVGGDDEQPGIAGSIADATQGIPGVGALQAGVRSVVRNQPYREAYGDIKRQTDKVPMSAKIIGRAASSSPLTALLPGSAAVSGAIVGGADQVLDANPDRGIVSRALGGAAGATGGALFGKGLEMGMTAGRVVLSPVAAKTLQTLKSTRAKITGPMYKTALAEGQGNTVTPEVYDLLSKSDIAEIVGELKKTRTFANVAEDAPEMLDAVYKVLSDRGKQIQKGLETVSPNRPNIGRFRGEDVGLAKEEALGAMDGPMPSYRPAVKEYAERTGDIEAFRKGYDTQRVASGVPTGKNLDRTTPEALGEWSAGARPSQRELAGQGAVGAARASLVTKPFTAGRRSVGELPDVLRIVGDKRQAQLDLLAKLGLLGTNASLR